MCLGIVAFILAVLIFLWAFLPTKEEISVSDRLALTLLLIALILALACWFHHRQWHPRVFQFELEPGGHRERVLPQVPPPSGPRRNPNPALHVVRCKIGG